MDEINSDVRVSSKSRIKAKRSVQSSKISFSLEKVLSTFLIFSLVLNIFLVFHSNSLSSQNDALTSTIGSLVSKIGSGSSVSAVQTPVAKVDTEPVNIAVLNDKRCIDCDVSGLLARLQEVFPTASIRTLDYSDVAGKRLYEETGIVYLPAIFFDNTVNASSGFIDVANYLIQAGNYYSLRVGAIFDPTKEVCNNGIDDTNDGKVDCDDPYCIDSVECRGEIPKKLDLFVMSLCPYGIEAEKALKSVVDTVTDIDLDIHYIASYSSGVFNSLHGQTEVDEDIRQLCVKKYNEVDLLDYILCRNNNMDASWTSCASDLDVNNIKACIDGDEGKNLLIEDIKIGESLGISASPTWMVNNRNIFNGITSEVIKTNYCKYNQASGCSIVLSDISDVADASC